MKTNQLLVKEYLAILRASKGATISEAQFAFDLFTSLPRITEDGIANTLFSFGAIFQAGRIFGIREERKRRRRA